MRTVRKTPEYDRWFRSVRDPIGRAGILARVERLAQGRAGDAKSVDDGVWELRVDSGPGYRVYYTLREGAVLLLLVGGDKGSQSRDIRAAVRLARNL